MRFDPILVLVALLIALAVAGCTATAGKLSITDPRTGAKIECQDCGGTVAPPGRSGI